MRIRLPAGAPPSPWPTDKAGVLNIAHRWYDPVRVGIDENALTSLELPPIAAGAEVSMTVGRQTMGLAERIELAVALNSINYQFWDLRDGAMIRYAFHGIVGALGMSEAFRKAWSDPGSPLSRARKGTPLVLEDVRAMFGDIPNPESRVTILNEVLLPPRSNETAAAIASIVADTGRFDTGLAHRLAEAFPLAYGDEVLKKAQLAISEVWVNACQDGAVFPCDLTAFADYQIPNVLRALGVLRYAPDLAADIDAQRPIDANSRDERALRAASILAVERMAAERGLPVAAVDHYLWTRRKEATTPFHLTFTTAY